eukprot:CAMPEP_0173074708 /NCGR_PEP_ID=MMETSP1102-20130122/11170_1 /TAXON_ID=49646 /ORGANISM="Geminigera sp., Strain Caron Lab Isolate" /LENGTH=125 /DNA_ID=CAMNT_0013943813 /DNA_START=794 /DNA_END=1171 /DNA_ORIENTATION=-
MTAESVRVGLFSCGSACFVPSIAPSELAAAICCSSTTMLCSSVLAGSKFEADVKAARASAGRPMPSKAAPRQACDRPQSGRTLKHISASSSAWHHCSKCAYAELRFESNTARSSVLAASSSRPCE